jgi:hypothetical protein
VYASGTDTVDGCTFRNEPRGTTSVVQMVDRAGSFWPSMDENHARTDEVELIEASGQKDWTSQTLSELAWKGITNSLGAVPLGGGRPPPKGLGLRWLDLPQ